MKYFIFTLIYLFSALQVFANSNFCQVEAFKSFSGKMPGAQREVIYQTSAERLMDVVKDFDRYPERIGDILSTQILEEGETTVVRFEMQVVKRVYYTVRFEFHSPYEVTWTLVDSNIFSDHIGSWRLEPMDDGRVRAFFETRASFKVNFFGMGRIIRNITEHKLPKMMDELAVYAIPNSLR